MENTSNVNQTIALMRAHHSTRRYLERPVSEEDCERVLSAALTLPSSCFLQAASVIKIEDERTRLGFYELSGRQEHVLRAPRFWVFCADLHRDDRLAPGADLGWTEFLVMACVEVGIVAQNALLAAQSLGLGGVFVGGIRNGIEEADRLLGLPPLVFPVVGLAFGWPVELGQVKPRLPRSVTVMTDRYHEPEADDLAEYSRVSRDYYAGRGRGARDQDWAATLPALLRSQNRSFMLSYLRSKGWAQR